MARPPTPSMPTVPATSIASAHNPIVVAPIWRRRPLLTAAAAILVLLAFIDRPATHVADQDRYHNQTATVVRVIAGNLLEVDLPDRNRPTTTVRLWGVRTDETATESLVDSATAYAREHVWGQRVRLLLAADRSRDDAGRLLAYVFLENASSADPATELSFNASLLASGCARCDTSLDHPLAATFATLERKARQAQRRARR